MEFYISAVKLQKIVKQLGIVARINSEDFTGLVSIEAFENNSVNFVANNISVSISIMATEDVLVRLPGHFVVEFGKFKSFIMSFPAWTGEYGLKEFKFTIENNKCFIFASNMTQNGRLAKAKLALITHDPYAVRQPMPFNSSVFSLSAPLFQEATNKVLYAIDPSDSRPFITGMYFALENGLIHFVGTNGRLISEYTAATSYSNLSGEYLLKYDFVVALKRLVDLTDIIEFEFDERSVKAKCGGSVLTGRLIIGHQFPNYRTPLENFQNEVVLDKDFFNISPIVETLNPDDNYRLTIELKDGTLSFYSDLAKLNYENVVDFDGNFVADVNGLFLKSTIEAISDSRIIFRFTNDSVPIIFDSYTSQNKRSLIMLLRKRASVATV